MLSINKIKVSTHTQDHNFFHKSKRCQKKNVLIKKFYFYFRLAIQYVEEKIKEKGMDNPATKVFKTCHPVC